jgi:hypothetical protein
MSQAVKISDTEMEALREAALVNSRSLSGQAEHWLRIGRAVERDPRFSYARIEQALRGLLSPDELDTDEQDEFFDRYAEAMHAPSATADAFWADRNRRGLGVGMDDAGNLVYPPNARN